MVHEIHSLLCTLVIESYFDIIFCTAEKAKEMSKLAFGVMFKKRGTFKKRLSCHDYLCNV